MNEKFLDDMTSEELQTGLDDLLAELERLEDEKAEQEKRREEKAHKFMTDFIEVNMQGPCKNLLLSFSGHFTRQFIALVEKQN